MPNQSINSDFIPPLILENYKNSLLGRLKLLLFEEITGKVDVFPTPDEVSTFRFSTLKKNVRVSEILTSVLSIFTIDLVQFKDLEQNVDVLKLSRSLRETPIRSKLFVEVVDSPFTSPSDTGVLVTRDNLLHGGHVYDLTFFCDQSFPSHFRGVVEIAVGTSDDAFTVSTQDQGDKVVNFDATTYQTSNEASMAVRVLSHLVSRTRGIISRDKIRAPKWATPRKSNPLLEDMIREAYKDNLPVTKLQVPLSSVRPFDIDFCLAYPLESLSDYIEDVKDGITHDMLVYWDGTQFVMDDDYCIYLAYRSLDIEFVQVAVLGDFPPASGEIVQRGKSELIPPIGVRYTSHLTLPVSKDRLLNQRLKQLNASSSPELGSEAVLMPLYKQLAKLLQNREVREKDLHRLLLRYPVALDAYGTGMISEVPLKMSQVAKGGYRIDLVLQYNSVDRRIVFVELENAIWRIFTKSGDLRKEVNHACRQVEDWVRWWHGRPGDIPEGLDPTLPAEGLVVIGRSIDMRDEDKKRLVHINHNRKVKIITYDDLLDRLQQLMQNQR